MTSTRDTLFRLVYSRTWSKAWHEGRKTTTGSCRQLREALFPGRQRFGINYRGWQAPLEQGESAFHCHPDATFTAFLRVTDAVRGQDQALRVELTQGTV